MCTSASIRSPSSLWKYLGGAVHCFVEINIVFESDVLGILINCGISAAPATLPAIAAHGSSKEVFEDGLKVVHIGVLSPTAIKSTKSSSHVAENILILESLEGVFLSGASLIIVLALALV